MGAAALNTDSNDSTSLQNGQVSSTDEEGAAGVMQVGTKREAPVDDDTNDGEDSLPAPDQPVCKKVKLDGEDSISETPEPSTIAAAENTTPVQSTNGDGH